MSLDLTIMSESCSQLWDELKIPANNLGYKNVQVMFSKTDFEESQKGIIYVSVEYHRLFYETKKEKVALRKIVPKTYEHKGMKSKVKLEYIKLPAGILKKLREARKLRKS